MTDNISNDSEFIESARFLKVKAVYKAEMMVDELHRIKNLIESRIEFLDEQIEELSKLVDRLKAERRGLNGSRDYGRFDEQLGWAWEDFFKEMEAHAGSLFQADKKEIFAELLEMPGFDSVRLQKFQKIFGRFIEREA